MDTPVLARGGGLYLGFQSSRVLSMFRTRKKRLFNSDDGRFLFAHGRYYRENLAVPPHVPGAVLRQRPTRNSPVTEYGRRPEYASTLTLSEAKNAVLSGSFLFAHATYDREILLVLPRKGHILISSKL